jgi:hypothetical protein
MAAWRQNTTSKAVANPKPPFPPTEPSPRKKLNIHGSRPDPTPFDFYKDKEPGYGRDANGCSQR